MTERRIFEGKCVILEFKKRREKVFLYPRSQFGGFILKEVGMIFNKMFVFIYLIYGVHAKCRFYRMLTVQKLHI